APEQRQSGLLFSVSYCCARAPPALSACRHSGARRSEPPRCWDAASEQRTDDESRPPLNDVAIGTSERTRSRQASKSSSRNSSAWLATSCGTVTSVSMVLHNLRPSVLLVVIV